MQTVIVIQARTGSTRLPNKVVRPFYESQSILDILLNRLRAVDLPVIVATSRLEQDDLIESIAKWHEVAVFRGPENDVVARFLSATKDMETRHIVRICADNPFINIGLLNELVSIVESLDETVSYAAHSYQGIPSIATHFGVFCEVVSREALDRVWSGTNESLYREHVTNYIHQRPEEFILRYVAVDPEMFLPSWVRLTVDTLEDFEIASELFAMNADLFLGDFKLEDLRECLEAHPFLQARMQTQIAAANKKFLFVRK